MKSLYSFWGIVLLLVALSGCSSSRLPVMSASEQKPVDYTLIYLIHGDANYWYHNRTGLAIQADRKILQEAKQIAENAENGEVFIFHLKPETKILWVFPRKDRRFWYYHKGELIFEKTYSPHSKTQPLITEAKLYHRFHRNTQTDSTRKKIVLYFGHEIPAQKGTHYFRSRPEALFSTELFAGGMRQFLQPENNRFDLTVLSTCANGTPKMVYALSPVSKTILASPQNLHLSQIDTKALQLLERAGEIETTELANRLAQQTYNRLSSFLQTVISLVVYNTNEMMNYLPEMAHKYESYLIQNAYHTSSVRNIDCAQLTFFNPEIAAKGVKVWYKPAQFGQNAERTTHSGWGCKQ